MNLYETAPISPLADRLDRKDKRLRKTYGWTLEMFNALGEKQQWKCGICGRLMDPATANVDHLHFHISALRGYENTVSLAGGSKEKYGWLATAVEIPIPYF